MSRFSYGERDYAFGQTMLTLRTSIGLTQVGLAERLGISRRAVGEWEAGSSYPNAQHLKAFLALCVRASAFPPGHEEEEIRALWKATHQKVLLDETRLSALLKETSPLLALVPLPGQIPPSLEPLGNRAPAGSGPRVDWGDALDVPSFYGRQGELATLAGWVVQEHCRVVSVLGLGGIGKSALVTSAMRQLASHFQVVLFRSLRDAPSCESLLESCLQVLSPASLVRESQGLSARLRLLLEQLRSRRVLLVLDNLESLLQAGEVRGR